jgi:hypothetical protein
MNDGMFLEALPMRELNKACDKLRRYSRHEWGMKFGQKDESYFVEFVPIKRGTPDDKFLKSLRK